MDFIIQSVPISEIYIYTLLGGMFLLSSWTILRDGVLENVLQGLTTVSVIGFFVLGFVLQQQGTLSGGQFVKDILLLGSVGLFFSLIRKYQYAAFICLAILMTNTKVLLDYLKSTHKRPATEAIKYDTNGEFLIQIEDKFERQVISELKNNEHILGITPAFKIKDQGQTHLDDYYILDIDNTADIDYQTILSNIAKLDHVLWTEPNEILTFPENMEGSTTKGISNPKRVNDPKSSEKWEYDRLEMDKYYDALDGIKVNKGPSKIYILDTGVDGTHEDLAANFTPHKDQEADEAGHGTHCAGIAAAVSNNGVGINSLVTDSDLVSVSGIKVLSGFGFGSQTRIIQGMIDAADAGASVISMSLGGKSNSSREKAYNDAVAYANKKGAVVVVAAGNSSADASKYAPASAKNVICVAASDDTDKIANFSNYLDNIEYGIAAPGKDILSLFPGDQYKVYSGTSMSTPLVAGLVANLKFINPDLTTKEIHEILTRTGAEISGSDVRIVSPSGAIIDILD